MSGLKTRSRRAKRPNLKSLNLSSLALAIWEGKGRAHNWSREISWYLVGLYATSGVTTTQRVTILKRLREGILAEINEKKRNVAGLNDSLSTINEEICNLQRKKE